MSNLLITKVPLEDETLSSFLLRICRENKYDNLSWITSDLGIVPRQLAKPNPNKINMNTLANFLDIEESVLWDLTFFNDIVCFSNNESISSFKDHGNTEYDKICPLCFQQNSYVKKFWNLKINMACPIHSLLLINICPKCNKKISSIRSSLEKCKCGFVLNKLPQLPLSEGKVLHSKILYNAYFNIKRFHIDDNSPIHTLEYFSLTKLINTFWFRINQGRNGIGINQINTQQNELLEQLTSVYNLFINWPYNFRKYIYDSNNSTTTKNIKRDFYSKLYEENFTEFREEFRKTLEDQKKRPVIFKKFSKSTHNFISLTNVIKILNMSQHAVNILIEKGVLTEYRDVKDTGFVIRSITTDSVNRFIQLKKYIVFKKELSDLLGLQRKHINLFENAGWIERIELFSKRNDKKSYYDIRFGYDLIEKIESDRIIMISEEESKNDKYINFSNFHNRAAAGRITFIELVDALINSAIIIYKVKDKEPFKSYFFNLTDAVSFIKVKRFKKFSERTINLHIGEVCHMLKVSNPQVASWVKNGLLNIQELEKTVDYNAIENFLLNYLPMTYLVNSLKTSVTKVLKMFQEHGVLPIHGPAINGGNGYIYRKSDIINTSLLHQNPCIDIDERIKEIIEEELSENPVNCY